jgi:hypothetical protein
VIGCHFPCIFVDGCSPFEQYQTADAAKLGHWLSHDSDPHFAGNPMLCFMVFQTAQQVGLVLPSSC